MVFKTGIKSSFAVIGKEGSTHDGPGFIQKLWEAANRGYPEIQALVKKNGQGNPLGFWGAMSDFSRAFNPWDNLSHGLYLAGAEVNDDALAPESWTKWVIPASEFVYAKVESGMQEAIDEAMKHLEDNSLTLAGAINDFFCPEENGQLYIFVPIRRL